MKRIFSALALASVLAFTGCAEEKTVTDVSSEEKQDIEKKEDKETAEEKGKESEMPESSEQSEAEKVDKSFEVKNGYILERDIIPQMAAAFSVSEDEIKSVFSNAQSELINPNIEGFKRMEGIIAPGKYEISKESPEEEMKLLIQKAEKRYEDVETEVQNKNDLTAQERLALASMIEAECLGGENRQETADVFLNRLSQGMKLQSCVTAEYALGYQRPYLTIEDTKIESPYNTYYSDGLPIGPIASFSDESLKAASGNSTNGSLMYFFYDYVAGDMHFYSDFERFNSDGVGVMDRFAKESKVKEFDKINKQELYGK